MRRISKITLIVAAIAVMAVAGGCSSEKPLNLEANIYIPDGVVENTTEISSFLVKSSIVTTVRMKVDGKSRRELYKNVEEHYQKMGFTRFEAFYEVAAEEFDRMRKELDVLEGSLQDRSMKEDMANTLYVTKGDLFVFAVVMPVPDAQFMEKSADGNMVCQQYLTYTFFVEPGPLKTAEDLRALIKKQGK